MASTACSRISATGGACDLGGRYDALRAGIDQVPVVGCPFDAPEPSFRRIDLMDIR
jgi:hypothetical protein